MPSCSKAKNPQGIEITFTEADHRYRSIIDGKEISYISGTTFLGKFFKPFDPTGEITRKCALKRGVTVEALKEEWRLKGLEATTYGTRVHETCEDVFNDREFRNTPNNTKEEFAFKHAKRISAKIKERLDILGIEYIVFNHRLRLAGTIDLFAKSKTDDTYYIIDHKTNKEIEQENKWNNFALEPISHVPDTNFSHYALQLNLYEYLLKYGKYVPLNAKFRLFLNHITENGARLIELPNYQTEIREMIIEHLLNN